MEEIILNGTFDELVDELIGEFNLSEEEARFSICISTMIDLKINSKNSVYDQDAIIQWYYEENSRYSTQFLDWHYNVNYSKLKKDFYAAVYKFFLKLVPKCASDAFKKGLIFSLVDLAVDTSISFVNNITRVDDAFMCVYAIAMEKYKRTKSKIVTWNDLFVYFDEYDCNYRDCEWKCCHMSEDKCTMTNDKLKKILACLCENNIFRNINETTWEIV